MTWFLVPAGSKKDSLARKNRIKTLQNKINISPYHSHLSPKVINDLKLAGVDKEVYMWGAKNGTKNPSTWKQMKRGDKVIFYAEENYLYYGEFISKIKNKTLADLIWLAPSGLSFEYIYFLVDVQKIDISGTSFNKVFNYTKGPQGFKTITEERISDVSKIHGSVEKAIEGLMKGRTLTRKTISSLEIEEEEKYLIDLDNVRKPAPTSDTAPKKPRTYLSKGKKMYVRDAATSLRALEDAGYECEINPSHTTFLSKSTGKQFMEGHHLVPMHLQDDYLPNSLDITPNIVSICPTCHRGLHHADYLHKKELVTKLLTNKRRSEMKSCGIDIKIDELLNFYM